MGAGSPQVATSMRARSTSVDLDADAVHLWVIDVSSATLESGSGTRRCVDALVGPESELDVVQLHAFASHAERARAARFRRPGDGDRFLAAHGALRAIMAGYLQSDPRTLRFEVGAWGKPALAHSDLAFNLSHSGARALVAVARGRQVGVDVERLRPIPELEGLMARVCTPEECAELAAEPPTQREGAFLALWTRKEALAKMTGAGLRAIERDASSVSAASAGCRVEQLLHLPGYTACVAAEGLDWRLVHCN